MQNNITAKYYINGITLMDLNNRKVLAVVDAPQSRCPVKADEAHNDFALWLYMYSVKGPSYIKATLYTNAIRPDTNIPA